MRTKKLFAIGSAFAVAFLASCQQDQSQQRLTELIAEKEALTKQLETVQSNIASLTSSNKALNDKVEQLLAGQSAGGGGKTSEPDFSGALNKLVISVQGQTGNAQVKGFPNVTSAVLVLKDGSHVQSVIVPFGKDPSTQEWQPLTTEPQIVAALSGQGASGSKDSAVPATGGLPQPAAAGSSSGGATGTGSGSPSGTGRGQPLRLGPGGGDASARPAGASAGRSAPVRLSDSPAGGGSSSTAERPAGGDQGGGASSSQPSSGGSSNSSQDGAKPTGKGAQLDPNLQFIEKDGRKVIRISPDSPKQ